MAICKPMCNHKHVPFKILEFCEMVISILSGYGLLVIYHTYVEPCFTVVQNVMAVIINNSIVVIYSLVLYSLVQGLPCINAASTSYNKLMTSRPLSEPFRFSCVFSAHSSYVSMFRFSTIKEIWISFAVPTKGM